MLSKVTGKNAREIILDNFKLDSEILKCAGKLFSFGGCIISGEPLSIMSGLAMILETSGTAISAGTAIVNKLCATSQQSKDVYLHDYDKFKALYYTVCLRSYIETIPAVIKQLQQEQTQTKSKVDKDKLKLLKQNLELRIAAVDEAELSYLFCVNPLEDEIPVFCALNDFLSSSLIFYAVDSNKATQIASACGKEALVRLSVYLAGKTPDAEWIRNYLAISSQQTTKHLLNDLESIKISLLDWIKESGAKKEKVATAWEDYRQLLVSLPDQKETMFNEEFGVRKVFVKPQATYHVAGTLSGSSAPKIVPDIAQVIGALISNRAPSDDLIILCGGPGSGKSTLCKILTSELAKNNNIHPIFLRLRRLKDGSDIASFIEESLHKQGVIDRLSDLRDLSNIVVILDGFDELVMASRARLRHFFNMLREEHSSGPLRHAKIIVSGRDTLFPKGDGLPKGSHVLSLLPFDKERVENWGKKWRALHLSNQGATFNPVPLIEEINGKKLRPLHHLVTWPLTLHLVARVHTAGKLDLGGKKGHDIEKAYLYRSIISETTTRQIDQAGGIGRLDQKQMREFLRAVAWRMYESSTDSMDSNDVIPLLKEFFPVETETELSELADVAVVNCPELTKGEETGFEFVHKSFSEYLVGERIAETIEKIIYKVPEYGTEVLSWRMSCPDAVAEITPILTSRLLTDEVQEMLEPMLGCLNLFLKGESVSDVVSKESRREGLENIVKRFEELLISFLKGQSLSAVANIANARGIIKNPLEAQANYLCGIVAIGVAAAQQSHKQGKKEHRLKFTIPQTENNFWKFLNIVHAGGILIDEKLADRMYLGLSVQNLDQSNGSDDRNIPIKLKYLTRVDGHNSSISTASQKTLARVSSLSVRAHLLTFLFSYLLGEERFPEYIDHYNYQRHFKHRFPVAEIEPLLEVLHDAGLIDFYSLIPPDIECGFDLSLKSKNNKYEEYMQSLARNLTHKAENPLDHMVGKMITRLLDTIVDGHSSRNSSQKDTKRDKIFHLRELLKHL